MKNNALAVCQLRMPPMLGGKSLIQPALTSKRPVRCCPGLPQVAWVDDMVHQPNFENARYVLVNSTGFFLRVFAHGPYSCIAGGECKRQPNQCICYAIGVDQMSLEVLCRKSCCVAFPFESVCKTSLIFWRQLLGGART